VRGRDTAAACWLMVRRGYCKGPAGLADCCSRRTLQLKCCFARDAIAAVSSRVCVAAVSAGGPCLGSAADAVCRRAELLARLRYPLRHRGLGLGPPGAGVVGVLVAKRGLGCQQPVAMVDYVLGRALTYEGSVGSTRT
jgi:hypothetical protein